MKCIWCHQKDCKADTQRECSISRDYEAAKVIMRTISSESDDSQGKHAGMCMKFLKTHK